MFADVPVRDRARPEVRACVRQAATPRCVQPTSGCSSSAILRKRDQTMNELPLTEQSAAGTYYVITRSRSVYQIVLNPDRQPQIVRYPAAGNVALHDGEPLTGVSAFSFDAVTGEGIIFWWKERPEDRKNPEGPYVGSRRRTSLVDLILRDTSGRASVAPAALPSE